MNLDNLIKSNLHTHTTFCDGKNTPEEIVKEAIALGMDTIGFSGHSFTPIDTSYCMTEKSTEEYVREVDRLREIYGERINVLCGIEMDLYGKTPRHDFDYIIGSVHYVRLGGEYCVIDHKPEYVLSAIREHCAGNPYQYVRAYYENVAKIPDLLPTCDVIGHFDLVTKFNEGNTIFDENDPRHLAPACEALEYLIKKDVILEVNTGAISRGYRKMPYPSLSLLRRIASLGGRVTLSSDAHHKDHLLFCFPHVLSLLCAAGFHEVYTMTRDGWTPIPISIY